MDDQPIPVVIARPVDWSEIGITMDWVYEVERRVHAEHPDVEADHNPLSGVYPGSVVRRCDGCGVRCWVPPRSLALAGQGVLVGCYRCTMSAAGSNPEMLSLGNPESARRTKERP